MRLSLALKLIWAANGLLKSLLVALLFRRQLQREVPVFTWYMTATLALDVVMAFSFYWSYKVYFVAFWVIEALSIICDCAVLVGIYLRTMKMYPRIRKIGSTVLWSGLAVLMISAFVIMETGPGQDTDAALRFLYAASRSMKFVQTGVVAILFAVVGWLRVKLQPVDLGIAGGFGIVAAVNLASYSLHSSGVLQGEAFSIFNMSGFGVGVLAWIVLLSSAKTMSQPAAQPVGVANLREWNESLEEMIER